MPDLVIPLVGMSGSFELQTPLNTLVDPNERYTCKAVRKLSDYIASNEDPKALIYDEYTIPNQDYLDDIVADMEIVSLQSDTGHWLYIPARFIVKYPVTNGIQYRSMMIGISLPSIPVSQDLTFLQTELGNVITDTLGVTPAFKIMETSRIVLVPDDTHALTLAARNAIATGKTTDRSRRIQAEASLADALVKIAALEAYIETNYVPPAP